VPVFLVVDAVGQIEHIVADLGSSLVFLRRYEENKIERTTQDRPQLWGFSTAPRFSPFTPNHEDVLPPLVSTFRVYKGWRILPSFLPGTIEAHEGGFCLTVNPLPVPPPPALRGVLCLCSESHHNISANAAFHFGLCGFPFWLAP